MPRIEAVGTALPPYVLEQREAREFARNLFGEVFGGEIDRLLQVFDNTEIDRRHFCVPIDWFGANRSFEEKNTLYIHNALELAEQAINDCLRRSDVRHEEIDYVLMISTTGLSTPSLDARLYNRLPFRADIRRLPVWGLGCAGGAAALSWARTITLAEPRARVLCVAVELCGLTFIRNDLSKAALIATALFADGAAAVLVEGDDVPRRSTDARPHLLASASRTVPDSLDVMGWDIVNDGFRIVISRDIPSVVGSFIRPATEEMLQQNSITVESLSHFIFHPGGARVLRAYDETFGLHNGELDHARYVLRTCGNMSSPTVLFVLQRFMEQNAPAGTYGVLAALGPGFSGEQVLVQWR